VSPTSSPPPNRPRRDPNRPGGGGRCARRLPRRRPSTAGGGGAQAGCTRARGAAVGASAHRLDAAFRTVCTGRLASVSGRFGAGCGPGTAPDGAHVCGGCVWVLWCRGRGLGRRAERAGRSAPPIRSRPEACDSRCSTRFVTALTSTAASGTRVSMIPRCLRVVGTRGVVSGGWEPSRAPRGGSRVRYTTVFRHFTPCAETSLKRSHRSAGACPCVPRALDTSHVCVWWVQTAWHR